jgi:hypothetical protein
MVLFVIFKVPVAEKPYDIIPTNDCPAVAEYILLDVVRLPMRLLLIVVVPDEFDGVTFIPVNPAV